MFFLFKLQAYDLQDLHHVVLLQIELFEWEGEDISPEHDGTITREVIVPGEKNNSPNDTSNVTGECVDLSPHSCLCVVLTMTLCVFAVHVVGTHKGRIFVDKNLTYCLGEGSLVSC